MRRETRSASRRPGVEPSPTPIDGQGSGQTNDGLAAVFAGPECSMNMFVVLTYLWTFLVGVAVGAWLNELTNGPSRRPLTRR